MKYLGTGFNLILGGMRLRLRIDLDDAPMTEEEAAPAARREDASYDVGTSSHGTTSRRFPHHVRSRRT